MNSGNGSFRIQHCFAAKRPLIVWLLTFALLLSVVLLGLVIINYYVINNSIKIYYYVISSILILITILLINDVRNRSFVAGIVCSICGGEPKYSRTRFAYQCLTREGLILCFSSVEELIFIIKKINIINKKMISRLSPPTYYCVKPLLLKNKNVKENIKIIYGLFKYYNISDYFEEEVEAVVAIISAKAREELERAIVNALSLVSRA